MALEPKEEAVFANMDADDRKVFAAHAAARDRLRQAKRDLESKQRDIASSESRVREAAKDFEDTGKAMAALLENAP